MQLFGKKNGSRADKPPSLVRARPLNTAAAHGIVVGLMAPTTIGIAADKEERREQPPLLIRHPPLMSQPVLDKSEDHIEIATTLERASEVTVHLAPKDMVRGLVDLSFRSLTRVLPGLAFYASNITQLDLSNNSLKTLPVEIGCLRKLKHLDVSYNQLTEIPATLAYCQELNILHLANNQIEQLPSALRHLHRLQTVDLAANRLRSVPECLWNLPQLEVLDLSFNLVASLPARMFVQGGVAALNRSKQLRLGVDGCPLVNSKLSDFNKKQDTSLVAPVASLVETIICRMANQNTSYPQTNVLPDHILDILDTLKTCDYCHKLFPESRITKRWRLVRRNKVTLLIEYTLCRPHWDTETERIALLFGQRNIASAQPYYRHRENAVKGCMDKVTASKGLMVRRHPWPINVAQPMQGLGRGLCRIFGSAGKINDGRSTASRTSNHQKHYNCPAIASSSSCSTTPLCTENHHHGIPSFSASAILPSGAKKPRPTPIWEYFEDDIPSLPNIQDHN